LDSLGSKLKTAREEKGYTLEYVSRETNIAIRYLDALEKEEFSVFPGEPYLLGFLKNYSTYLDLNSGELLSLYRSFKLQEQPVPVDELLKSPSKVPAILGRIAVAIGVLALAGGAAWFFLTQYNNRPVDETPPVRAPVQYTMNNDSMERRFYRGDTILVPVGGNTYRLELSGIGDTVTLTTPAGPVRLDLSQEATVDLTNDGSSKLLISVADFERNNTGAGAHIRFDLQIVSVIQTQEIPEEELPPLTQGTVVLMTSPNAFPFTLQAAFQGYCLFRYEVLFERDNQGRIEQYYQNSDQISVYAQNGVRLGMSNAHAVRLQVIGGGRTIPLDAGGPGEVVVGDLRWLRDDENRFRLVFARLE